MAFSVVAGSLQAFPVVFNLADGLVDVLQLFINFFCTASSLSATKTANNPELAESFQQESSVGDRLALLCFRHVRCSLKSDFLRVGMCPVDVGLMWTSDVVPNKDQHQTPLLFRVIFLSKSD